MSQFFASGGQSIGVSASTSVLYTAFLCFCLEKILWHLLKSWFGGAEFSQLFLVCKAFEFSFISE